LPTLSAAAGAFGLQRPDNKWLVAASISFGAIMATIDISIVNVALPQIRGSVGASIDQMTALGTSFAIAQVIVMPLTAFLGRFFGQKRVYLFCLGLFVVGSMLCGLAHTLPQLIAARALQGFGAGALQPSQMAILRQTFPPREQGMAMAVVGMVIVIGPAIGPTLGGWIVDNWSWPWIFYINLPVGILGILATSRFVHEPPDIRAANRAQADVMRRNLDWQGILYMSIGVAALQYVLQEGNRLDWFDSRLITLAAIAAAAGIIAFVLQELHSPAPAVNLRQFRDTTFASATIIGGIMFANLMANMFLLPVFMQEMLGFTALKSGLALMPRALIMLVATPIVGRIYNLVSPRVLVALGLLCVALGSLEMGHFTLMTSDAGIIRVLLLQGVGFAMLFVPLTTVALSHVERTQLTDASGPQLAGAAVRRLGGPGHLRHPARAVQHACSHGFGSARGPLPARGGPAPGADDAGHGRPGHGPGHGAGVGPEGAGRVGVPAGRDDRLREDVHAHRLHDADAAAVRVLPALEGPRDPRGGRPAVSPAARLASAGPSGPAPPP
jgi:MFS transporter, DHA2 family, multidrug resistance protein